MGLKDLLFGGGADREKKQRERSIQKLNSKNSLHEDRMAAIEALAKGGGEEAAWGLVKRFDWTTDKLPDDRAEKDYVRQVLEDDLRDLAPAAIQRFLRESDNVSFPVQIAFGLQSEAEVVGMLLEALALEVKRDSFKPDKKVRLLDAMRGHPDPRIPAAVGPLLRDFDDRVRFSAVELLLEQEGEEVSRLLLDALVDPDEESQRVRSRILRGFAEKGWSVGDRRDAVARYLDRGQSLDAQGHVIAP